MKAEKIRELAAESFTQARDIRRELHRYPEGGRREYKTTDIIKSYLEQWGIEYACPLETGVVAEIKGAKKGRVLALRADIDALPLEEKGDSPFKSCNKGYMHACGHDLHTAALLTAARFINENRQELEGSVRLIFQPDEEGDGGAARLIEAGAMEGVEEILGIHVAPELPRDCVAVKYGKFYAASDVVEIDVKGKGGHGAMPHKNVDAILVASHIITALQSIISRNTDPLDSAVITIGTINGGIFRNTVAEQCSVTGIIRSLGKEMRQYLARRVTDVAKSTADAFGAEAQVRIIESYPGIVNCDESVTAVKTVAGELFGDERVKVLTVPGMVTEDFGYYLEKARGCFYHVGCSSRGVLHSEDFCPDERALETMVAMHLGTAFGICE